MVTEQHPDPLRAVLSAQLTRTEFRVQLLAAGVFGALADPPLLNRRAARRSVPRAPRFSAGRLSYGEKAGCLRPQFYRWSTQ